MLHVSAVGATLALALRASAVPAGTASPLRFRMRSTALFRPAHLTRQRPLLFLATSPHSCRGDTCTGAARQRSASGHRLAPTISHAKNGLVWVDAPDPHRASRS